MHEGFIVHIGFIASKSFLEGLKQHTENNKPHRFVIGFTFQPSCHTRLPQKSLCGGQGRSSRDGWGIPSSCPASSVDGLCNQPGVRNSQHPELPVPKITKVLSFLCLSFINGLPGY